MMTNTFPEFMKEIQILKENCTPKNKDERKFTHSYYRIPKTHWKFKDSQRDFKIYIRMK